MKTTIRQRPSCVPARRGLLAVASVALLAAGAPRSVSAQGAVTASFDWSMPDRFGLDDRSIGGADQPDTIPDYLVTFADTWNGIDPEQPLLGSPAVRPSSWRVLFDARASSGDIVSYRWEIDGVEAASSPAAATASLTFPDEGRYDVTLTVTGSGGESDSVTREVVVQDWLIVAIGDSYASGEGNPELGDGAWFEQIIDAVGELEAANAQLAAALEALRQAEIRLELTRSEVAPALAALNRWNAECPSISLACVDATADLIFELGRLGFSEARQLIERGVAYVRTQINNLVNVAQAAVNSARETVQILTSSVAGLQDLIDILFQEGAAWQTRPDVAGDRSAHRTSFSGQALAALAIERLDPRTSVTFVHLAYSGARITKEPGSSALIMDDGKAQIDDVVRLVGDREIDALVVSIGGNDTGFANIIMSLALADDQICGRLRDVALTRCRAAWGGLGLPPLLETAACERVAGRFESLCLGQLAGVDILPKESHEELLRAGLAKLRDEVDDAGAVIAEGRFTLLQKYLADPSRLPHLPGPRVYFTEYPNLAEGDDGELCPDFLTVTAGDWRWVRDVMTTELNATIREEVTRRGWGFIDGIFDGFSGHGFCADDHWVYYPQESMLIQGDAAGTAHPTYAGHAIYGESIARRLRAELYAAGDLSSPRLPGYGPPYRRGDVNDDGSTDISDASRTLDWLFLGAATPACAASTDTNGDGATDISDATYLLVYLFLGGAPPPEPFVECAPLHLFGAGVADCAAMPASCR